MAFEDELDPDWFYELPFYLTAVIAYGALFTLNPTMRWGARERAPEALTPIEFVATLPPPSPNLAPAPGGDGTSEKPPQKGPGKYEPEKVKAGAVEPPPAPKPVPSPKPAAVKAPVAKPGPAAVKPKAKPKPAARAPVKPAKPAVDVKAMVAASMARREKADAAKAAKAAAAEEAARRAAEAKAAAEVRAEKEREEAAARKAEADRRAELLRQERARKAEEARLERERRAAAESARQEQLAAERAAKAAKRAELSHALATMNDPDEALDGGAPAPAPSGGAAKRGKTRAGAGGGGAGGSDGGAAALAGERRAGAAAALADTAESPDPGDAAGSGGTDLLDAKAKGGGTGPDASGVSYSLDGPVGSRRVLARAVPVSPDWVGTRGLDLTVTVRFQVLPDGSVKPGAVIQKTSGFPEIDKRALDALRRWRFEAIPAAGATEVWGRVKFRFTS